MSQKEKCKIFLPHIVRHNEIFFYNNLYNKTNYLHKEQYEKFPDNSYYRMSPRLKKRNKILLYTYDVQHIIYNHQHPTNCEDKKYLLITGYPAGQGIELRVIASLLGLAIHSNRIALYHPYYKTIHSGGSYCNYKSRTWECFLEKISNCSINDKLISKAVEFKSFNQSDIAVIVSSNVKKYLFFMPKFIYGITKGTLISEKELIKYWSIQSLTYVTRLNKRTYQEILNLYKNEINKLKHKKCMSVWIRHGDKIKEMKLIPTQQYEYVVRFFKSIVKENFYLYISSDDPNVFEEINIKYPKIYLHFNRTDYNRTKKYNIRGSSLTLYVLADIMCSISCYSFCGTIKSNIIKVINDLRTTVGFQSNSPYFEMSER